VRAPQAGELSGKVDAEGKEYEDYKEGETWMKRRQRWSGGKGATLR
jgi:hypothetical protein